MARPTAPRRSAGASSRSRSSRGGSSSSRQAMLIGALGVLVLVLVVVFATNSGGARAGGGGSPSDSGSAEPKDPPPVAQPASVPSAGKAGKTPDRPAPPLTADTLTRLDELHRQAVLHYNDSVRARTAGDNTGAREAAGKAKDVLDQWQALIEPNLRWQEYADMEDWAQPAEYMALEQRFQKYAELNKKVRMAGG